MILPQNSGGFMKLALLLMITSLPVWAISFPDTEIKSENPFNGIQYDHVKVGPTQHIRRFRTNFLVRYITVYNKEVVDEPVKNVFRFEENCHDQGNRIASWEFTRSYTRSIQAGASFKLLGLFDIDFGGELSRSFDITITRWIQAELGVQAIHTAILRSEKLVGMTYKQIYYPVTGKTVNEPLIQDEFFVNYVNPIFRAQRTITGTCE